MVTRSLVSVPAPSPVTASPVDVASLAMRTRIVDATSVFHGKGMANALRALVIALICHKPQNVFFVGTPGTGKTFLSGALAQWLSLVFLDVQFSPWTDVAELFGAVDLAAFNRRGRRIAPRRARHPGGDPPSHRRATHAERRENPMPRVALDG